MEGGKGLKTLGNILQHPASVFSGLIAGVIVGIKFKPLAQKLSVFGDIYLNLLKMCVLPIMVSAVVSSIGKLLMEGGTKEHIRKLATVFIVGLLTVAAIGVTTGVVFKPGGNIDRETKIILSKQIMKMEKETKGYRPKRQESILSFIKDMIPVNIFKAASEGKTLSILFFSLLIGIAFGVLKSPNTELIIRCADATYEAVLKLISWFMYGLPFGLFFLFADQMSRIGLDILKALFKTILLLYVVSVALMVFYTVIIWIRAKKPLSEVLVALKEPLIVAFGTSSSFAAIPFALRALSKGLGFDQKTTDLVIPLGMSLNPHGNVLHFSIVAIFMAQLYGETLTMGSLVTIVFLSVLAAVAASGAPGMVALSMLSIVLEPLGLPVLIGVILFTAVDPIVDPVLTVVNVYANCAADAIIAKKGESL